MKTYFKTSSTLFFPLASQTLNGLFLTPTSPHQLNLTVYLIKVSRYFSIDIPGSALCYFAQYV